MAYLTLENMANGLMLLGAFFVFTGGIGIIRMKDFYSRLHPAGVVDSLGVICIVAGIMLHLGAAWITLKYAFLLVIALITSATACHALGLAAWRTGLKPQGRVEHRPGTGGKPQRAKR